MPFPFYLRLLLLFFSFSFGLHPLLAQKGQKVSVHDKKGEMTLKVNGKPFMINGMNWDYIPIGTHAVNANFWQKPDEIIRAGLDAEMSLLKLMNVNAVRIYSGIPRKWIAYIYQEHGIYTMLNHSFGRYGLMMNDVWEPVTDYADPVVQEILLSEVTELAEEFKGTPGLLMYLLGNENNYGLFWAGNETEDFPDEADKIEFVGETRGRPMFRLMNEAALKMKAIDPNRPIALCNGDVLFIEIIADECPDVDIYGTNVYRGVSFGDMFEVIKAKLNKPIMFTEFGADAYNAKDLEEDQEAQAYYMVGNWKEIYENAAGLGKAGNAIGGFTFQFSDGWWKFGFDHRKNEHVQDNNASWANGGYPHDFVRGKNNMNEEWFGICAKGPTDERGLYRLYPRAAYYALKQAHQLNPYAKSVTLSAVNNHFEAIDISEAARSAKVDKAALAVQRYVATKDEKRSDDAHFPFDFEDGVNPLIAFENGATASVVENSVKGHNSSDKVLEFNKKEGSAWYSGIVFNDNIRATPLITLANGTVFKINIWSPNAGVDICFKLEGGTAPELEIIETLETANEWVTLTFDFTDKVNTTDSYQKFAVFPDFDPTKQTPIRSGTIYYIDDIIQE
ncbi:MAG: glycoside hydrolase family 2 TIM barrel-domain containing protein [Bacteroidota bacterium]